MACMRQLCTAVHFCKEMRFEMKIYLAPLEGITTFVYRNVHHALFDGVDKYYTPFVSPTSSHNFKSKEKRDVIPENNTGLPVVPQILSNHADEFIYTAHCLEAYGYEEINLNVGCPSGTVVSKGRGAGFLGRPEELDRFLDEVFEGVKTPISIKTRIGVEDPEEFYPLLQIFNRYPVCELTIHPRVRRDFYRGCPNLEVFEMALKESRNPVCYNGDIRNTEDYERICRRFPDLDRIMIGRGVIADPGLTEEIYGAEKTSRKKIFEFEQQVREEYKKWMPPDPVLFKMKEIWSYMSASFPEDDKFWKKIKKSKKLSDYEAVMRVLKS